MWDGISLPSATMTRYIVKGFTACNQHLFTEVIEAPTKTDAEKYAFAKLKRSPDGAVMVALTTYVDVQEAPHSALPRHGVQ